ncbi:MAG: hypothetical protein ACRCV3_01110 [Desulfovibrionaceae bacterium]
MIIIELLSRLLERIIEKITKKSDNDQYTRIKKEYNDINNDIIYEWMRWVPRKKQKISKNIHTAKTRKSTRK